MTETSDEQAQGQGEPFDPRRLRTLIDMRRSRDGRMIAGVCTGAARHLGIDPIIIRIVLATLTFFGLAGVILYAAAWLLIPEDDAQESIAAKTFNFGAKEEQFRIAGLIVAAIIAIAAASSLIGGDAFDTPFPYLGLLALGALWWFVIRPHQRDTVDCTGDGGADGAAGRVATAVHTDAPDGSAPGTIYQTPAAPVSVRPPRNPARNPRRDHGTLTAVTLFAALAAIGAWWTYAVATDAPSPVFVSFAIGLGVLGAGMVVGALTGNGRPLIGFGVLAGLALAVSAALPSASIGYQMPTPTTAAQVKNAYTNGIGGTGLDLSQVSDLDALAGRTITVTQGIGDLRVHVPAGLDVDVDAATRAGQIELFGRGTGGTGVSLHYDDSGGADPGGADDNPRIHLVLDQTTGVITVDRR